MASHPAVFLDRDGTLIEEKGYIDLPSAVAFYSYTFKALKNLQQHFLLFIISNQSGISKGIVTQRDVEAVNRYIVEQCRANGVVIYDTFYCPHRTEGNCICKKPSPYFINLAAGRYHIDLSRSFMIGDHPSDAACGINAGVTSIYLMSGHGRKHYTELKSNVQVCGNIWEASHYILKTIDK